MIVLFTDFGLSGPYVGQVKAVLYRLAPAVPVVDLFADAPTHDPRASAYLLASFRDEFPVGTVFECVVDPGVGSARAALAVEADGRWFVGPDNGLFEPILRRAKRWAGWALAPGDGRMTATFHGRDLFAPAAARLALGMAAPALGATPIIPQRYPDWPDDLAEVVYVDHFGNLTTGLRAAMVPKASTLRLGGWRLNRARTYADVPQGEAFWYENSNGLVEIAVNQGRACDILTAGLGTEILIEREN